MIMNYYHPKVMKNQVGSCEFYLVIAPRYFLEHITVISRDLSKKKNQIAGSTNDLV